MDIRKKILIAILIVLALAWGIKAAYAQTVDISLLQEQIAVLKAQVVLLQQILALKIQLQNLTNVVTQLPEQTPEPAVGDVLQEDGSVVEQFIIYCDLLIRKENNVKRSGIFRFLTWEETETDSYRALGCERIPVDETNYRLFLEWREKYSY